MTTTSAAAIAVHRLCDGFDVVGRDPDAGGCRAPASIVRLALEHRAIRQLGMQRDRLARDRHDAAAHGENAVRLAHALLEVAGDVRQRGDEQVAKGVAGEVPVVIRCPWEIGMEQAASWRARRRRARRCTCGCRPWAAMPISVRSLPDEPPSSATVTTAVMLLVTSFSPRNSDGQAGAAADGDDARAARRSGAGRGARRAARARPRIRLDERAQDAPRAVDEEQAAPTREDDQRAPRRVRNWSVSEADQVRACACPSGHCTSSGRRISAAARAMSISPSERDDEPALDADARPQPAAQDSVARAADSAVARLASAVSRLGSAPVTFARARGARR